MILLDGKKISKNIEARLKKEIDILRKKPKLSVVLVGKNPASKIYVSMKKKKCSELGIHCEIISLEEKISQEDLLQVIKKLNEDKEVTAILIQLPLPRHINSRQVLDKIDTKKDVDGLTSYHLMKILLNQELIIPCTPKGILELLRQYNIKLEGRNICVVGFSDIVGKPLATLCLNRGATVTVCHSKTENLKEHTQSADIIMTATGVPNLIKADMVKDGVIVIDIGISKLENKIVGDADFEKIKDKCSYITPVPGGVGPMTIISLIQNLLKLTKNEKHTP